MDVSRLHGTGWRGDWGIVRASDPGPCAKGKEG